MAEAYGMTYGLAAGEWFTSMWNMALKKNYSLHARDEKNHNIQLTSLMKEPDDPRLKMVAVTDAKALYDNLVKEATSQTEKRASCTGLDALGFFNNTGIDANVARTNAM